MAYTNGQHSKRENSQSMPGVSKTYAQRALYSENYTNIG